MEPFAVRRNWKTLELLVFYHDAVSTTKLDKSELGIWARCRNALCEVEQKRKFTFFSSKQKPNIYSFRYRSICWWNFPEATTPFCLQTAWILNAFIYTGKCDSWVDEWCLGWVGGIEASVLFVCVSFTMRIPLNTAQLRLPPPSPPPMVRA